MFGFLVNGEGGLTSAGYAVCYAFLQELFFLWQHLHLPGKDLKRRK